MPGINLPRRFHCGPFPARQEIRQYPSSRCVHGNIARVRTSQQIRHFRLERRRDSGAQIRWFPPPEADSTPKAFANNMKSGLYGVPSGFVNSVP